MIFRHRNWEYLNEVIGKLLANSEYSLSKLNEIDRKTDKIDEIDKKIDSVLKKLEELETKFDQYKKENRDVEEKLCLMISRLSKADKDISEDELEDYCELAKTDYEFWDEFDENTQRFIPVAEYLFSKLNKYEKADYSPVVLELCRALENEFLLKLFRRYTKDLIDRKSDKLNEFLAVDRSDVELVKKTNRMVNIISRAAREGNPKYTLGEMSQFLSLLNSERTLKASPLLQDFRQYIIDKGIKEEIFEKQYTMQISEIVNKYRNKSAHPDIMHDEIAIECKKIMPERMNYFMGCIY